mmetsp:Transcript_30560/g.47875  ORF Transcript_30560/g.47875 Transcript_30560/m.47875 type:complete len:145 (+) Transcript_30560:227-661(+)|eukprot:CAMPEP_0184308608 /NCGR_PEP_ID=MMETSP1049-20130417/17014_1 /TAXON_ID=77928 /ORGANISM="Proteomonas sulcata, Strain CCMP704" /LENGTH=144 /DNA_ID=CAMNT_0026621323 /DNA_START=175 /DNA_END=609 /DNA_ORIENTATION=+
MTASQARPWAAAATLLTALALVALGTSQRRAETAELSGLGTGRPIFSPLQDDADRAASGVTKPQSGPRFSSGDGFPSFKDWIGSHKNLIKSPPSDFDEDTQMNGPDSEPMHLARLYTAPDASLIHSAAVAAGAAAEDGDQGPFA